MVDFDMDKSSKNNLKNDNIPLKNDKMKILTKFFRLLCCMRRKLKARTGSLMRKQKEG